MRAEFAALKSRLLSDSVLAGRVEDVVRRSAGGELVRDNYVVLSMSTPAILARRHTQVATSGDAADYTVGVQVVAVDAAGAMLFVERVQDRLLGHRLSVAGRSCWPLRQLRDVEEGTVRFDRSSGLFYAHVSFGLHTEKAS